MPTIISGTTGISGTDGTAATPAIQGTDTNTGIFFPAADTIAFAEGGTEVMRIDSAGNVGIGTTSPGHRLHISNVSPSGFATIRMSTDSRVYDLGVGGSTSSLPNNWYLFDVNAGSTRIVVDSGGRITTPAQPAFNATIPYTQNQALWPNNNANFVNFGSVHLNRGGHFNATNGRFTAPVAGAYFFCAMFTPEANEATNLNDCMFAINDIASENYSPPVTITYPPAGLWQPATLTAALNLNANDFVTIRRTCCNNNKPTSFRMNFTGYLIG